MLAQFDDHIQDMRANETNLGAIVASQRFGYLPPVGLLPVVGTASPAGFNPQTFFGALASKDVAMLDGSLLRSLLHEALYHEPIDLSSADSDSTLLDMGKCQGRRATTDQSTRTRFREPHVILSRRRTVWLCPAGT